MKTIKQLLQRRGLGLLGIVMLTQLLSACVVLPVPYARHHAVIVGPGYGPPPPRDYRDDRRGNRDDRGDGDRHDDRDRYGRR